MYCIYRFNFVSIKKLIYFWILKQHKKLLLLDSNSVVNEVSTL